MKIEDTAMSSDEYCYLALVSLSSYWQAKKWSRLSKVRVPVSNLCAGMGHKGRSMEKTELQGAQLPGTGNLRADRSSARP